MPQGDKTKEPAFRLWKAGRSLKEIQMAITGTSGTKASSVAGWVKDWERGSQKAWAPKVK
jgi:hypothetical protein